MSSTPLVVRLMAEQRKRCLATILTSAENSPWWPLLNVSQQNHYREQVRGALAIFYDLARDVLKVSEEDGLRNDLALDLIRSIHSQQVTIVQRLDRSA